MAQLLFFNIPSGKRRLIRMAAESLGIRCRVIAPEDFGKTIGTLAETDLSPAVDPDASFSEEMLVLADLDAAQFHGLLDSMRREGLQVALKAALTDSNSGWSAAALCRELAAEHAEMQRMRLRQQEDRKG